MESRGRLIFDIEADGLLYAMQDIWCICMADPETREVWAFKPEDISHAIERLKQARTLIGHNIIGYDLPAIWKVTGEWAGGVPLVVDTLVISRALYPERYGGHGLASWGELLGFPKIEYDDWTKFTPEMLTYCEGDVELNRRVLEELEKEYGSTFTGYKVY